MSDEWDDDNNDNSNVPKALRDAYERIKADLKAERETRAKLETQVRQSSLSDTLTSLGYSRKIAAVVPQTVEANEEKLRAWLDENAEIFPKVPTSGDAGNTNSEGTPGSTPQPVQDRMGAAVAAGIPAEQMNTLESKLDQADSAEAVEKVLKEFDYIKFK